MSTTTPDLLGKGTSMGAVELHVRDLDLMLAYYRDVLALERIGIETAADAPPGFAGVAGPAAGANGARHLLGRGGVPTVTLTHSPHLPVFDRAGAGLFHTAVLFESRQALAAAVARVASSGLGRFTGSADHLVSEAFYFDDPEGNGVELYFDRPATTWKRDDKGKPLMATLGLDPQRYLSDNLIESELEAPRGIASVGHVHLQVGSIAAAKSFYVDTVGFDEVANMGSALFVAAGGYHHHVGLNVWNSRGAGPRAASLGLGTMALSLASAAAMAGLKDRLAFASVPVADDGRAITFRDPWGSVIAASVSGSPLP